MHRTEVLQKLADIKPELFGRFGVTRLALFGSTARDLAHTESDIDLLISFEEPATSSNYFGALFLLEDRLGCRIDLVTEKALRAEIRPHVEKDAIYV